MHQENNKEKMKYKRCKELNEEREFVNDGERNSNEHLAEE
jgi:hypothetical protein